MRISALLPLFPAVAMLLAVSLGEGQQTESPEVLFEQAKELHLEGSLEQAAELYEKVIPRLRENQDQETLAAALNALSVANSSLGRYVEALAQAEEAARLRQDLGDRVGEAMSLSNLGLAHYYLGEFEAALDRHRQALELARRNQDAEGQVADLNSIANVFFLQGNYSAAWEHYQQALSLIDESRQQEWAASERYRTLVNLAALFQKLGLYDRSLDLYSQLEDHAQNLPLGEQAQLSVNRGALYRRLGDPVKAKETYLRAKSFFEEQDNVEGLILVHKNLGIVQALDFGDLGGAVKSFETAERLAARTSNRREVMQAQLYLAEALRRSGESERSRALFSNALTLARQMFAAEETWKALYGLGRIEQSRGRNDRATDLLDQAARELESLRSRLQLPSLRTGFLADKREVFDQLIALLMSNSPDNQTVASLDRVAFLIEQARQQPFNDRLGAVASGTRPLSRAVPGSEDARSLETSRRRLAALKTEMTRIWQRQITDDDPVLRQRLTELETEYLRVERETSSSSLLGATLPPLAQIQSRLAEKTVLIDFWLGRDELGAIVIDRDGADFFHHPFGPAQQNSVAACADSLAELSDSWQAACQSAADAVLGPRLEKLIEGGFEHWIIVPDRHLNFLPFEVLKSSLSGELLLEKTTVSYLPDLWLFGDREGFRRNAFPWADVFAGFGNPETQKGALLEGPLDAIENSAKEVELAAGELPGRSRILTGPRATRQALTESARDGFPILHLASHATLDALQPDRSRVLLSPSQPGSAADYLFLGEILDFPLSRTDLIVLSACETAGSASEKAGGVENFGRAFLYAGARSSLTTLWKVDDQATASFMQLFYRFAASGQSKAQALRSAKLRFFESGGALSHHYYWAPFVLYGDGQAPLPLPWSWRTWLTIPLFLLAVGSGFWAWRRSHRQRTKDRTTRFDL